MNSEPLNRDPQRQEELHRLAAGACDATLSPEEWLRLEAILLADADARAFYVRYVDLHARLGEPRAAAKNPPAGLSLPTAPLSFGPLATDPTPAVEPPLKSPILGFLGGVVDYVGHSRRLMFLLVAGMLSGWFIFQVGSVIFGRWLAGDPQVAKEGADQPGAPGAGQKRENGLADGPGLSHGKALAWLSGSTGGRWLIAANSAAIDPATGNLRGPVFWEIGTEFVAGQQVNLVAGLGEITFRSGAKVVVSAPAQFSIASALGADLQVGKLTARVPHDAIGFTVNTPQGSVVDLGTEFGVEVTSDRKLDVQVFVGNVKINAAAGAGAGADQEIQVSAGKTAHVEPGKPASVVESKDKDRFQRDLKIASDSNDKQTAAYLDVMRQLKPVVWLRMEGKTGDRTLHDEMGGAPDGKLHWDGEGNPFVEGRIGKGLWLRGDKLKDYAIMPDYPKAEHGRLSVSAWVYADSQGGFARIATNWADKYRGQFHLALVPLDRNDAATPVVLCAEVVQPDASVATAREDKSSPFPLHEWQHVAFTADGTTLRLYREGREVATSRQHGLIFPPATKSLGIGVKCNETGDAPSNPIGGFWSGKLDEIAIFNDVLSPDDIKKLAAAPPR